MVKEYIFLENSKHKAQECVLYVNSVLRMMVPSRYFTIDYRPSSSFSALAYPVRNSNSAQYFIDFPSLIIVTKCITRNFLNVPSLFFWT